MSTISCDMDDYPETSGKQIMEPEKLHNIAIIQKNHWKNCHQAAGYTKQMRVIDNNIIHCWVKPESFRQSVVFDYMDAHLLQTVITESGLIEKKFHILLNLEFVQDISFKYKQAITDLFFNWSPILGVVCFYNIPESMRITVETFAAVAPQKIVVLFNNTFTDGIRDILSFKAGELAQEKISTDNNSDNIILRKQFLMAVARISWLNMLDEPIATPPAENRYYPYFMAIESLRTDLIAKEQEKMEEIQKLNQGFENRLKEMVIKMNAQAESSKKLNSTLEKEITVLKQRVAALDMELTKKSTTIAHNNSELQDMLDQIYSLEIDSNIKQTMTDGCLRLMESEMHENQLGTALTESDTHFLTKLQKQFPNLNKRDLRICLLVRLNYNTTEIAQSIGISTRGMESIRFRLHKKLGLGKHQSIKSYFSEFAFS